MLTYARVDTDDTFKEFVDFAATFNHKENNSILPIHTIRKDGELIAYFKTLPWPVLCPAFHPDKVSPRDFKDIVEQVGAWANISSISQQFPNGTVFLAVENRPAIDRSIIEKLGFKDLQVQVWQQGGA
jgi:hypothetical protein